MTEQSEYPYQLVEYFLEMSSRNTLTGQDVNEGPLNCRQLRYERAELLKTG